MQERGADWRALKESHTPIANFLEVIEITRGRSLSKFQSEVVMKKYSRGRTLLVFLLAICLSLPVTVFGGGKPGKKNFKEGAKYESAEQWDLAAEQYALAVVNEPDNAEYRLRMLRAMQMASLMFAARGDLLEAKGDFAGAYNAYARAFTYDRANETTRIKMSRMVEQQKSRDGMSAPARYNPRNGNLAPVSNEIQTPYRAARGDILQRVEFNEGASLKLVIKNLARHLGLNVIFDESFKDINKFSLSLDNVTPAKTLDMLLTQSKHTFEQLDRRTILIYADNQPNRQRFEKLLVKTFYLGNMDLNEARDILQSNLGQRQVRFSKQLNALVIRATAAELSMAQAIIDSLDKNRSEVVLDVNIYEVSNTASLELGNQLATQGLTTGKTTSDSDGNPASAGTASSLLDLGGLGRNGVSAIAGSVLGFGGSAGALIGMPTSSLSLLQSKGKSKLLANTQIHALDGENNQVVVGRYIPYRGGIIYPTFPTGAGAASAIGTVDNIQYRDVGLVIDVTPTITNEGYVQVKMKLESSNVEASGSDAALTPSFSKRQLTTISRVQDGVTAVVASVKQDNKGDSRVTIPGVGMIPILGRLFTTPRQTSNQSDIVITVTPHIIRPAEIKPEDHYARFAGTQQSGFTQSIEVVIYRAEVEEDQERRLISQQPSMPLTAPTAETSVDIRNAADDKASPPAKVIPVNLPAEIKPIPKNRQ
jgi:general secretion pathway protein D